VPEGQKSDWKATASQAFDPEWAWDVGVRGRGAEVPAQARSGLKPRHTPRTQAEMA
jgi:hypothetical protein